MDYWMAPPHDNIVGFYKLGSSSTGTLGGLIVLMLWIYIASLILLVGAETDHEIEKLASDGAAPKSRSAP
jgi:uncharacterized BrkB/YihY/UPF0761 family membrane protein